MSVEVYIWIAVIFLFVVIVPLLSGVNLLYDVYAAARRLFLYRRERERIASNRCVRCNYELKGLAADTTKCPECGEKIKNKWYVPKQSK